MRAALPLFTLSVALALAGPACHAAASPTPPQAKAPGGATVDVDFFEKKIRPLLSEHCYKCHSATSAKIKGGLKLDAADDWLRGGDTGPAIVPGDAAKSLLVQAVRYRNPDMEMPPKGKLPDADIELLATWVQAGAPAPQVQGSGGVAKKGIDVVAGRQHWAYQPIRRPPVPAVKDASWPAGDIDRFILARLEAQGIHPVADAAPETLVRRLYFDLTGLPPAPEEIDAYLADPSPGRFEALVDRLLASPRFGERWGRHWLDVARFAESLTLRGFVLGEAWRYRDHVIQSFNEDRPFDQFMAEQVAGDLMSSPDIKERRRQIVATAFLAIGNTNLEEQDKKQLEMDVVDEQIDTIGRAFLAQTIGCARCHDHKFDPIPTRDYYALAGILHSSQALEHDNVSKWLNIPLPADPAAEAALKAHEDRLAALAEQVKLAKAALATASPTGKGGKGTILAVKDLPGIVVDDTQAKRVGTWRESTTVMSYIGDGYLTDDADRSEMKTLTYLFEVPEPGKYEVRFSYPPAPNRASNLGITVFSSDGEKTIAVDERLTPPIDGHFISLGHFNFEKNGQSFVIVSNQNADGSVCADAVQFLPADAVAVATAAGPSSAGAGRPRPRPRRPPRRRRRNSNEWRPSSRS